MFCALGESAQSLRPKTSHIAPHDWEILARQWYPVAVEGDLKDTPMRGKLLDLDLVIARIGREITVALDRCPHRYIRLSAGQVVGEELVCRFHGLAFNARGECTRIPALGRDAKIPPSYRMRTFRSEVRYGLVWACLEDQSEARIPTISAFDEAGRDRLAYAAVRDWPASAARQTENFFDIAHFPFVHAASIGVPDAPLKPLHVDHDADGFTFKTVVQEHRPGDEELKTDHIYFVKLPFTVELISQRIDNAEPRLHMASITAPISAYESRVFMVFLTGLPVGGPRPSRQSVDFGRRGGGQIILEDIETLSHLPQEHDLPLDQKHEIHIPGDNVGFEYRKRLVEMGIRGQ
jgi:nitrite reductase/ring-hydroxylating ferredoxin subunit